MTRGKPQQETNVGDSGDGSHAGGGGGWGGGNDDSTAGGGCGGDDSDRGAAAESRPSSSDGASAQDQARGHSVHGTQPRPRRVDVPQHLIATPSALGRPKRDRAVGEDDRASVYFATRESTV